MNPLTTSWKLRDKGKTKNLPHLPAGFSCLFSIGHRTLCFFQILPFSEETKNKIVSLRLQRSLQRRRGRRVSYKFELHLHDMNAKEGRQIKSIVKFAQCNVLLGEKRKLIAAKTPERLQVCLSAADSLEVNIFDVPQPETLDFSEKLCFPDLGDFKHSLICHKFLFPHSDYNFRILTWQFSERHLFRIEKKPLSAFVEDIQLSWTDSKEICGDMHAFLPLFAIKKYFDQLRFLVQLQSVLPFWDLDAFYIGLHRDEQVICLFCFPTKLVQKALCVEFNTDSADQNKTKPEKPKYHIT